MSSLPPPPSELHAPYSCSVSQSGALRDPGRQITAPNRAPSRFRDVDAVTVANAVNIFLPSTPTPRL